MKSAKQFLNDAPEFLDSIVSELVELGFDLSKNEMDHFCLRTEKQQDYERLSKELANLGELLVVSPIAGREIATFRLHGPIVSKTHTVALLELPAPKEGQHYLTALEHCEFVIEEEFETFVGKNKELEWGWRGSKKKFNPELSLALPSGRTVKFHHQSLFDVIQLEKAQKF